MMKTNEFGYVLPSDPAEFERDFGGPKGIDPGIKPYVKILRDHGVETFESCQGGEGHAFSEPTIRFYGTQAAGPRGFSVAHDHGLPVQELRRYWAVLDGELVGPQWEMTFREGTAHMENVNVGRGSDEEGEDYTHLRAFDASAALAKFEAGVREDERRRGCDDAYRSGWEAARRQQNVPEEQRVDPPTYQGKKEEAT